MNHGQYALLEAALPDRAPEPAGVFLYDPLARRLEPRLRRDWEHIADPDDAEVLSGMEGDLRRRIGESGAEPFLAWMEDTASNVLRIGDRRPVEIAGFEATLNRLYREHVPARVLPFRTHVPLYSLRAAAGKFGEAQQVEAEGWIEAPPDMRLEDSMFAGRITGRSMEPAIPDGSLCVFRARVIGSRQGSRLLVEDFSEPETGGARYTVKRYRSAKRQAPDGSWEHDWIRLEPLNPEFEPIELREGHGCRVIAEFVRVVE
jgi:SOS-response transcriptional repressor LexA